MTTDQYRKQIQISIHHDLLDKIDALAKQQRIRRNWLIREILRDYTDKNFNQESGNENEFCSLSSICESVRK